MRECFDLRPPNVLQAGGAQEALQLLQGNTVDVALLDVVMPGMNGIVLAGRIQHRSPKTKIVLMTGFRADEIAEITGKNNPYRIIWKPFKTESLLQMIENVLGASDAASV